MDEVTRDGKRYARKKFGVGWSNCLHEYHQIEERRAEFHRMKEIHHPFVLAITETYSPDILEHTSLFTWLSQYVVSEMCGVTLEATIQKSPMSSASVLSTFAMLVMALEQIHSQGFVHRNLSSAHVFLDENGKLKLGS